jgi:nucleotide-binding universal stress UspA family protein
VQSLQVTKLLCATDLLPKSESAIDRAGLLAEELGADLTLLHVVSPVASERVLEQSLQIAIARMKSRIRPPLWRTGKRPDVVVLAGNPARQILDTIAREEPDLLIVGPHDRRGVLDALEGRIAEKSVSARKCPVLVVQDGGSVSYQHGSVPYRNILLALDVADGSGHALRTAERFVLKHGAQATVVHACESSHNAVLQGTVTEASLGSANDSLDEAAAAMRGFLQQESADSTRYELVVAEGNPVPTIMRAIGKHQPDLLVIGTRGDGRLRRAVLGSVASQLLQVAPCDVLIVPRGGLEASTESKPEMPSISRASGWL